MSNKNENDSQKIDYITENSLTDSPGNGKNLDDLYRLILDLRADIKADMDKRFSEMKKQYDHLNDQLGKIKSQQNDDQLRLRENQLDNDRRYAEMLTYQARTAVSGHRYPKQPDPEPTATSLQEKTRDYNRIPNRYY